MFYSHEDVVIFVKVMIFDGFYVYVGIKSRRKRLVCGFELSSV